MKEKLICISTPSSRTYYKAVALAEEFLDKEHNIIHTTGTLPNGPLEEYIVSSVTNKQLENGKLHGKMQIVNLSNNTITLDEQYEHGNLIQTDAATPSQNNPENGKTSSVPIVDGTIVKINKGTKAFYVNGQEVAEETVSSSGAELLGNIPDGEVKELDENNKVKAIAHYKNNKRHGVFVRYDESGDIILREEYIEGVLNGPAEYVSYCKNNFLHAKCFYKNALLEGKRAVVQKDGTLREKENYLHGHLEGECSYYYPNGSLELKATFKDGKLHGDRTLYFPSGEIWTREHFINGFLEGNRTSFFANGKLYCEEFYEKGVLTGPRKIYAQDGTLLTSQSSKNKEKNPKQKK